MQIACEREDRSFAAVGAVARAAFAAALARAQVAAGPGAATGAGARFRFACLFSAFEPKHGHSIYLIYQGMIHNTRMALSEVGKQRDVDVVTEL